MSSSAAKIHEQLSINELSRVHEELISVASKWKFFGGNIGVLPAELSNIEKSNADFDEKLYKVLEYRLKQVPLLTWHDIVRALTSPAVNYSALASQMESKYSLLHTSSQHTHHPSDSRYDQTLLPNIPRAQCSYTQSMPPCVTTLSSGDYITPSNYSLGQHPVSSASAASHLISTQSVPSPSNLCPATETISAQSPTHSLQSYSPGQQSLSFSTPRGSIPPVRTSSASATEGPPATKRLRQGSSESLGTQPQSQSTCTADIHHYQHLLAAVDPTFADPSKVSTFINYGVGPPEIQSDQGTRELEKDDLKVFFDALLPVAEKYVFFGIQIGVDVNEIDEIRKQVMNDTRECLLRILRIRLGRTPALTWKDIDTALRSKAVDESRLANALMQEYGHLFVHKQTFESQEDGRKGSEKKHKSTKNKGKYVGEDRSLQVGKERETDSDEEVSESEGFRNLSETPRTDDKSTKAQRKVKKAKKPLEPEKGSEREIKQRGEEKKHADISPVSESKVAKNSRERPKGSRQKCKVISEQRAPKEVLMKYESEPSSGKYESKVHKSKHKRKDSGRSGQKCSEKKQVLLKSESISSSEEEIVRSKCVIHKSEEQLRKSSRKCSEQIAPKLVQSKSESESSASSSEEEMVEVDESETAEEYSSEQEIDSDHGEVGESDRKSDNISTKTQRRVKKAKRK